MKQKIIIKVSMHCSKCRSKAMTIAAEAEGVISVALHGADKDKLMIVGDGVDAACLTSCLRKKLCHASLEIVEEVKEPPPKKPQSPPKPPPCPPPPCCPSQVEYYRVVADHPHPAPCTIM